MQFFYQQYVQNGEQIQCNKKKMKENFKIRVKFYQFFKLITCNIQQQQITQNRLESNMNAQAQILYNSLLNDQKLMPLSLFKSNKFSKYNLFPHAQTLPQFFETNLQSDSRVVKYLKGPQGVYRGFYYQLFKLGFQLQNSTDYSSRIKNILFDPNLFSQAPSSTLVLGKQYNITQYQRIIAQFIKNLQSQVIPNAELTFSQYPIIDEAMITILMFIVDRAASKKKIDNVTDLLAQLCGLFGITLQVYENCFSFGESDVFLYAESPVSFYLAFLSQMAQVQSYQKTSQSAKSSFKQQISSNSYIESKDESNIYKDIRLSAGNRGTKAKVMNRSLKDNKNSYAFDNSEETGPKNNNQNIRISEKQYQSSSGWQGNNRNADGEHFGSDYHKNVFENSSDRNNNEIDHIPNELIESRRQSEEITKNKQISIQSGQRNKFEQNKSPKQKVPSQQQKVMTSQAKNNRQAQLINQQNTLKKQNNNQQLISNLSLKVIQSNSKNQGLYAVFQSMKTYRSFTDSMGQGSDKMSSKKLSEIDLMSKLAGNKVSQSKQQSQVSKQNTSGRKQRDNELNPIKQQSNIQSMIKQRLKQQNIKISQIKSIQQIQKQQRQQKQQRHQQQQKHQQHDHVHQNLNKPVQNNKFTNPNYKYEFKAHKYQFIPNNQFSHLIGVNQNTNKKTDNNIQRNNEENTQVLQARLKAVHAQYQNFLKQRQNEILAQHSDRYSSNFGQPSNKISIDQKFNQFERKLEDINKSMYNNLDKHSQWFKTRIKESPRKQNVHYQEGTKQHTNFHPASHQSPTGPHQQAPHQLININLQHNHKIVINALPHVDKNTHTYTKKYKHERITTIQSQLKTYQYSMHWDNDFSTVNNVTKNGRDGEKAEGNRKDNVYTPSPSQDTGPFFNPKSLPLLPSSPVQPGHSQASKSPRGVNFTIAIDLNSNPALNLNQNHNISKQDTLGTFYRQFSDTKIMEIMEEPHGTRVRLTRSKWKGIRSKNWRGFF